jgi:hypothetical protein
VRLGWHGATDEETFTDAFVRATLDRVVEIHDAHGGAIVTSALVPDTVLDEQLDRVRPETREQMIRAFRDRLDREYEALAKRSGDGRERIVRETAPVALDVARKVLQDTEAASVPVAYSDHELMRRGRAAWEASYAGGMTDEGLRDAVGRLNVGSPYPDDIVLFSAKWAVHAFQRLMTSHTFAAALMCSDVQREVLVGIEQQWDAFLVVVPNGMLITGELEFSRVLVATYSFGARITLLTTGGPNLNLRVAVTATVTDEAPTLADLLVSDGSDLDEDDVTRRCLVMAKRLVAGLLLNLQDAGTHKIRKVEARPKSKGREAEPEHRIVTVGAPLEIDCRDAVREYVERGTRSSETGRQRRGAPTVQVMVRGHFRMQACGPHHSERRKTWIRPHWRGPEAALIQTRPGKVGQ